MTFLSPLLLVGLLGMSIPPIIHLLLRRKPKRVPFSTLEFISRSHRKTARRFRLHQVALMLVRSLFVGLLAIAVARPLMTSTEHGAAGPGIDGGVLVIVVDTSYPMAYKLEGESLLTRAKLIAGNILDRPNIQVGLVIADSQARSPFSTLTGDVGAVRKKLVQTKVGTHGRKLNAAVGMAYSLVSNLKSEQSAAVVVISTPIGLKGLATPPVSSTPIRLIPVDVAEGSPLPNRTILDVSLKPAPQMGVGHWEIAARVGNFASQPVTALPIQLEIDDKIVVNGFMDIPKEAEATKTFYIPLERERKGRAAVVIEPDSLVIDDKYPFWLSPAPPIRILAINGDPNPTPYRDEVFYLDRAIPPALTAGARIKLVTSGKDTMHTHRLRDFDVVVLANVESLDRRQGNKLNGFVRGGGGLLTTVGNRTNPEGLNTALGVLLPRTLRATRVAGDAAASREGRDRRIARLKRFDTEHPILGRIGSPETTSLALVKVRKYMLLDPSPTAGGRVVISLDDGAPLLLTKELDKGRTALLTTTIDRDWSDLPIRPHFLPLLVHTLRYLTRTQSIDPKPIILGQPASIDVEDPTIRQVKVRTPSGDLFSVARPQDRADEWSFDKTTEVGHYRIDVDLTAMRGRRGFAVRVDPIFSRLKTHEVAAQKSIDSQASSTATLSERTELWHIALGLLFVMLGGEAALLFRRRREDDEENREAGGIRTRLARGR